MSTHLWLRRMDGGRTLLLAACVDLEPTDDGTFCATVRGLGDSLIGMGATEDEAVRSAHVLLHGRVDHVIERGGKLADALGELPHVVLPAVVPPQPPALPVESAPAWAPAVVAPASA